MLLDLERLTDSNIIIMGDFNIQVSAINRSSTQKFNHETSELIDIIDQKELTDVYRLFYPEAT
jgi:exonuclease III